MTIDLRYPTGFLDNESDYLSVRIFEFKRTNAPQTLNNQAVQQQLIDGVGPDAPTSKGRILLPIPSELSDTKGVDFGPSSVNAIAAAAAQGLNKGMQKDTIMDSVNQLIQTVGNVANLSGEAIQGGLVNNAIASAIINSFGGNVSVGDLLSRNSEGGLTLNPNMELLFRGPQLRTFTFNFQLSPRNETESQVIKDIIRTFKTTMAPRRQGSAAGPGVFLKTPDIFQLKFKKGGGDHPFLFSMKPTALTNMQVSYTGSGTYATYHDGTPVLTNMSLTFSEMAPIYNEDYTAQIDGVGF